MVFHYVHSMRKSSFEDRHTHTHSLSLSLTHTLSHTHTHTHSLSHTHTLSLSLLLWQMVYHYERIMRKSFEDRLRIWHNERIMLLV